MKKKCNPGVGAVPVIMIVLQIGPTYQTCIYLYAFEVAMQKNKWSFVATIITYILTANGDFEFDPVCFQ